MYEVFVRAHFSAAHHLRDYPGDCEKCHGHNWSVEVAVRCTSLDHIGMGLDFRTIKKALRETLSELDHADLNELSYFRAKNPSSENIAAYIYKKLQSYFNGKPGRLQRVTVGETPETGVSYWED